MKNLDFELCIFFLSRTLEEVQVSIFFCSDSPFPEFNVTGVIVRAAEVTNGADVAGEV